jgi:hypothetical protein
MLELRHIGTIVAVLAAAVLAIGINRIVVTDGHLGAAAATAQQDRIDIAFKSDSFPLER